MDACAFVFSFFEAFLALKILDSNFLVTFLHQRNISESTLYRWLTLSKTLMVPELPYLGHGEAKPNCWKTSVRSGFKCVAQCFSGKEWTNWLRLFQIWAWTRPFQVTTSFSIRKLKGSIV